MVMVTGEVVVAVVVASMAIGVRAARCSRQ
jgi:hypothetical protein